MPDVLEAPHQLPAHEALLLLQTDPARGLSSKEAARRLGRWGPNVIPRIGGAPALVRFLRQFNSPLVYVLLAAAAVTFALGESVDGSVILGVAVANAVIGFVQEARAERALDALVTLARGHAVVMRDGVRHSIPSEDVVPGDLLVIEAGDVLPADVRLIEAKELEVDESVLTGESLPARKSSAVLPSDTGVGDRTNMAYSSTQVTRGAGAGVVVATGAETELGEIHRLVAEAAEVATPLTRRLAGFAKLLTVAIVGLAAVTYAVGLARGEDASDLFMAAVALAVGAIPEGLPAAITITLAVGVGRMARRQAIVRQLPAVETLGSTTVICTDKTGTLTTNEMAVQRVVAEGAAVRETLLAGALCNDSHAIDARDGRRKIGDPTETALLDAAAGGGVDAEAARQRFPRISEIPFATDRRYMATLHELGGGARVAYVKGAVEQVVDMCASRLGPDGEPAPLDADAILATAAALAEEGLRVLAFARGAVDVDELDADAPPAGLVFLGLQAMMDPPRGEAAAAVAACRRAGVAVKMITGDHAGTAAAVARRVGIHGAGGLMTGRDMERSSDEELAARVPDTAVFARMSAAQKLRLVSALQAGGEVVAMTGDGVNDAPALKTADIGVAMGRTGTQVARDASDIVLADDDFATIEAAVEEGRRIFDNLVKFIVWTLPTNIGQGLLVVVAIGAGVALPVLPVQILWINMTTAVALGLMLAFERQEPGIMERPPRDPRSPLLTRELVGRMVLVAALLVAAAFGLFEWAQARGMELAEARTIAANAFVAGQIFYLFNCRALDGSVWRLGLFSNPRLLGGVATMVALQLAFTYAPPMHTLFHSAAIDAAAWLRVVGVGLAVSLVVGAEKMLHARRRRRSRTIDAVNYGFSGPSRSRDLPGQCTTLPGGKP